MIQTERSPIAKESRTESFQNEEFEGISDHDFPTEPGSASMKSSESKSSNEDCTLPGNIIIREEKQESYQMTGTQHDSFSNGSQSRKILSKKRTTIRKPKNRSDVKNGNRSTSSIDTNIEEGLDDSIDSLNCSQKESISLGENPDEENHTDVQSTATPNNSISNKSRSKKAKNKKKSTGSKQNIQRIGNISASSFGSKNAEHLNESLNSFPSKLSETRPSKEDYISLKDNRSEECKGDSQTFETHNDSFSKSSNSRINKLKEKNIVSKSKNQRIENSSQSSLEKRDVEDSTTPLHSSNKTGLRRKGKAPSPRRSRSLSVSSPKQSRNSPQRTRSIQGEDLFGNHKRKPKKSRRRTKMADATESISTFDDASFITSYSTIEEVKARALHVHHASLNALVYRLEDTSFEEELVSLFKRIENANGIPIPRKAPSRANQIIYDMLKAMHNDPEVTRLNILEDKNFGKVGKRLAVDFAESLKPNLHLTSLVMTGLGLRDNFVVAIASSVRDNFTLENLELADNCFTSKGLLEFCCGIAVNESIRTVDIKNQQNSVVLLKEHEREAMEAIIHNKYMHVFEIDVSSPKCQEIIELALERNMKKPKYLDYDKALLDHCRTEASNAEQISQLSLIEERLKHQYKKEMSRLSNLAVIAMINHLDISGDVEQHNEDDEAFLPELRQPSRIEGHFPADGSFLNQDFISNFLEDDPSSLGVIFNFSGQFALFREFSQSHDSRKMIVKNFVESLVNHKQASNLTRIIMRGSACEDDFVQVLCEKCQGNSKVFPKLFLLDLGMNCITDDGVSAISTCIGDRKSLRYLQVLILQNQYSATNGRRTFFSSTSELALATALCQNLSILRLSLVIRNLPARRKIEGYLERNSELLEQARIMKDLSGKFKSSRNELEQQIDRVAANDPAVWQLDCSADQRFFSLKRKDVMKIAKSLSHNSFVTEVRLDGLHLDDEFAFYLSESIENNFAIRTLGLEKNEISGEGIKAIVSALAKNRTIVELKLRQQGIIMRSEDEKRIVGLLGVNKIILKLEIDIKSDSVRKELTKRLINNQKSQWIIQRRLIPLESPYNDEDVDDLS